MAAIAAATFAPAACSEKKGGLMLSVNTDMQVPKDVSLTSVTVFTNDAVKFNTLGRVRPDGIVELPSTLAIAEPDDENATVRVRVMAFQSQKPRVLRDIRTTVPKKGRIAYLRIPLNFLDDASATGTLPPEQLEAAPPREFDATPFLTTCPDPLQTSIDGVCKDTFVDSSTLPDWDPSLVKAEEQACFDPAACLADAKEVDVDLATCSVAGQDVTKLNLAFKTSETGICLKPGECFEKWTPSFGPRGAVAKGSCPESGGKGNGAFFRVNSSHDGCGSIRTTADAKDLADLSA